MLRFSIHLTPTCKENTGVFSTPVMLTNSVIKVSEMLNRNFQEGLVCVAGMSVWNYSSFESL